MSGTTFTGWGHYPPNNHTALFKKLFALDGLDATATAHEVLQFMLNAPVELLLKKSPAISVSPLSMVEITFSTVIEG